MLHYAPQEPPELAAPPPQVPLICRCWWALMEGTEFRFIYVSRASRRTLLQHPQAVAFEPSLLVNSTFFRQVHREEEHLARLDAANFFREKTLYGTITKYILFSVLC